MVWWPEVACMAEDERGRLRLVAAFGIEHEDVVGLCDIYVVLNNPVKPAGFSLHHRIRPIK